MKNGKRTGHSAKRGNSASPYMKYNKRAHVYSPAYHEWRRKAMRTARRDADNKPVRTARRMVSE